jgi:predicted PurR-regulated permease PerM
MPPVPTSAQAPLPPPVPSGEQTAVGTVLGTAVTTPAGPNGEHVTAFRLSVWTVARCTLTVALVLAGLYLLWRLHEVLLLLLLAILFATAIEPLVERLRHGPFSRGQGILIVYTVIFLVVAGIGYLFVPSLVAQVTRFVETLPQQIAALRPQVEQVELAPLRALLLRVIEEAGPAVQQQLAEPSTAARPEELVGVGGVLAHSLMSVVTIFLLAFYWLAERAAIKRGLLRLVPPTQARGVNATWLEVESKLGAWVRGQLLVMLALGVMAGVAFTLLGLPNPLLLAVLAGLLEIVPILGPFLAFIPALLVAVTVDPFKALLLIPIAVVIQQIEGNVLVPRIMSHVVGVSPLTVVLGILIGSILYGPAGAFLAVPVAAAVQVILSNTLAPALEEPTPAVPVPQAELQGDRRPSPAALAPSKR